MCLCSATFEKNLVILLITAKIEYFNGRMKVPQIVYFFFVFIGISSCKKDPVIISGNQAPPDKTIENVVKENYVNKLYISLLGRKATEQEFNAGYDLVKTNFSLTERMALVSSLQTKPEYIDNEIKRAQVDFLNESDTNDANTWITIFTQSQSLATDPNVIQAYQTEIDELKLFKDLATNLKSGAITFKEMHSVVVNNFIYDQVNMGTENFVVSMFQNFLSRYPTTPELTSSKQMIDFDPMASTSPVVFLVEGNSKSDFIDIFFNSQEYYEGQIRAQYVRFLFREPSSQEMSTQTSTYKNSNDYKAMQKNVLASDEYAGIK